LEAVTKQLEDAGQREAAARVREALQRLNEGKRGKQ
jgi:hypothetical protein